MEAVIYFVFSGEKSESLDHTITKEPLCLEPKKKNSVNGYFRVFLCASTLKISGPHSRRTREKFPLNVCDLSSGAQSVGGYRATIVGLSCRQQNKSLSLSSLAHNTTYLLHVLGGWLAISSSLLAASTNGPISLRPSCG